jgi:hypothetical protein
MRGVSFEEGARARPHGPEQAYVLVPSRSGLMACLGHAAHTATPSAANVAIANIAVGG